MLTQSTGIRSASFQRVQAGTSMIEVLVAILLVSIGMLAAIALPSYAGLYCQSTTRRCQNPTGADRPVHATVLCSQ